MQRKLSELGFGDTGVVTAIQKSRHDLNCMGVRVGKKLKMITKQPINGPVVVLIGEAEVAMGLELAEEVMIDVSEPV